MPKFRNIKIKKPGGGTRMQRAQVLKSGKLKFVKNVKRGGKKAAKKAPARKKAARRSPARKAPARRKSVATKSNPGNKSPKIGAAIQSFKGGHAVLAPVVEAGIRVNAGAEVVPSLQRAVNLDLAESLVIEGANHIIDRKIAHGAALSRGSVTAWLAEGVAALAAANAAKGTSGRDTIRTVNTSLSRTLRGYNPQSAKLEFLNDDQRNYNIVKIGGGVVRRVSNMGPFKSIFAPAKKFLGDMGGAL